MNTNAALSSLSRPAVSTSSAIRWTGRILKGFVVVFLTFDAVVKVLLLAPAVEGSAKMGFGPDVVSTIGIIQIALLALYLVPRTAPIGAVLWTGYLGGAVATHVRMGNPLFSHTLSPIYAAILLWLPLYIADKRVRALIGK